MALPKFYNQGDQDIYASGNKFIPQEQYRLDYTPSTTLASTVGNTGGVTGTQAAAPYIWPPQGGGGGGGGLGGKWGNLDLSKGKMFDKNVFSTDMVSGPPSLHQKMTGSFKPQQVQGYYNPTLGQYQTLEGKNINHLGINVKPVFASMLESMGVGGKKNKLFDHEIGDIEGTFSKGWESGKGKIKQGWKDEKEKWSKIFGSKKRKEKKEARLQKEIKDYNKRKWKEVQAEKEKAAQTKQQWQQDYSNWQSPSGRDHAATAGIGSKESKQGAAPGQKGASKDWRAEGGMVKDLTKDPEYRGWKKMYEMNPELGSMHTKHPAFIKFYKKHERDQKKFGGLAGLLYG